MRTLIIENQTGNQLSYLSGALIVPANSNVTVPSNQVFQASKDPGLVHDCTNSIVLLSDGDNTYGTDDAINYLDQIASSIASAVVGLTGGTSPSYAILVGGEDPSGNIQAGQFAPGSTAATTTQSALVVGLSPNSPLPAGTNSIGTISLPTGASTSANQTNGSQKTQIVDASGNVISSSLNSMYVNGGYTYKYTSGVSELIKGSPGYIGGIYICNTPTNGGFILYDNTSPIGTVIATFSSINGPINFQMGGLIFNTGLYIQFTSPANVLITYR